MRVANLTEVDVPGVGEAHVSGALGWVAASLQEQDDRLGDVLVREEGEPYRGAAAGRGDPSDAAMAAPMSSGVRSG